MGEPIHFTQWEIGDSGIMYKWAWHIVHKLNKQKGQKARQEAKLAKRSLVGESDPVLNQEKQLCGWLVLSVQGLIIILPLLLQSFIL